MLHGIMVALHQWKLLSDPYRQVVVDKRRACGDRFTTMLQR